MTKKIKVAIFDASQRAEIKNCEITDDGQKIRIKSGGKAHFMPSFDNTSYLDMKTTLGYKRIYFVRKNASSCMNFQTEKVPMPDPKQVIDATGAELVTNFGKEKIDIPWYVYLIMLLLLGIALKVYGVIV